MNIELWKNEPNRKDWTAHGLPCTIRRHGSLLHLCGYVGLAKSHPLFGKSYSENIHVPNLRDIEITPEKIGYINTFCLPSKCDLDAETATIDSVLQAHGGITFSGPIRDGNDLWWFGFDCSHLDDMVPGTLEQFRSPHDIYRDMEYVTGECDQLAEQLAKFTAPEP